MPTTNIIVDDTNMSDSWEEIPARDISSSSVRMNGVIPTASQDHPQINGVVLPTPSASASATAVPIPRESLVPLISATAVPSSFTLTSSTGPGNRENLASSRSVTTRFGGAPILPIAGSSGDSSIAPNSSLGLGGTVDSGGRTAHSLNGELTRLTQPSGRKSLPFSSAAFNSPNSALGLSTSGTGFGSTPTLFSSSKRKPNAFYKPPIVNNPPLSNPFSIEDPAPEFGGASRRSTTGSHSPERPPSNEKQNRNRGVNQLAVSEGGRQNGDILENEAMAVDEGQGAGLDYPLFVNAGSTSPENNERKSRRSLISASSSANSAGASLRTSQKRPPGAFTDEEDEDMIEDIPSHPPPRQTRSRKSNVPYTSTSAATANAHTSASAKSSASASTSARTTKPRGKKPRQTTTSSKSKRRVPGGMSDDDDDDEEDDGDAGQEEVEEDQDHVAPLAARRTMRKTRSSVASALSTEEPGPRRRSSRISVAGETGAGGASSKRVTRKSTAGTGGKRKQR
ncbi:hypothetical protein LENED_005311 [Lentinula edodes]|uniref:Uncharacterized protein n=1 Tax=Lentinula edodes TaxID=5353 RepID=A0A1Q3E8K9_LENED|nr:hypothetical protein LENED_005311 [Lentinula edodes]